MEVKEPDGPVVVVVPLLAGPDRRCCAGSGRPSWTAGIAAELTDVFGPHPLLAEALHVRLSGAGLARADRARSVHRGHRQGRHLLASVAR